MIFWGFNDPKLNDMFDLFLNHVYLDDMFEFSLSMVVEPFLFKKE